MLVLWCAPMRTEWGAGTSIVTAVCAGPLGVGDTAQDTIEKHETDTPSQAGFFISKTACFPRNSMQRFLGFLYAHKDQPAIFVP